MVRKNLFQNRAKLAQILRWKILCHLQPQTYKMIISSRITISDRRILWRTSHRNLNPNLCPIILSLSQSFTFWLRWKANKEWQELQSPRREKRPQQSIAASSLTDVCKETCPTWTKKKKQTVRQKHGNVGNGFLTALFGCYSCRQCYDAPFKKMISFLCAHSSHTSV